MEFWSDGEMECWINAYTPLLQHSTTPISLMTKPIKFLFKTFVAFNNEISAYQKYEC